jgi:hypothetical protein
MTDYLLSVADVIEGLLKTPVTLQLAEDDKGLPAKPGFYAWWMKEGAIAGIPPCPHTIEAGLHLLYVGIAPSRKTSSATIRARVIGNHIRGNTGSSTFRLTLASLLFELEKYQRKRTSDRVILVAEDNQRLTHWQRENLRLTWAEHPNPFRIEGEIIERLKPPLNLAGNQSHPFWQTLSRARKNFRSIEKDSEQQAEVRLPVPPATNRGDGAVTLHQEIESILREHGGSMTTQEIAEAVRSRGRYIKRDGTSNVSAFQVHGRTKNYTDIFERDGSKVRLRGS